MAQEKTIDGQHCIFFRSVGPWKGEKQTVIRLLQKHKILWRESDAENTLIVGADRKTLRKLLSDLFAGDIHGNDPPRAILTESLDFDAQTPEAESSMKALSRIVQGFLLGEQVRVSVATLPVVSKRPPRSVRFEEEENLSA